MKLASTTEGFILFDSARTAAEMVRAYEGTGFRYLDFSFGPVTTALLGDDWMPQIEQAAKEAERLGFTFIQSHTPGFNCMAPSFGQPHIEAYARCFEACRYLGIPGTVIHSGFSFDMLYPQHREEYFRQNRAFYEALLPYAEKYNVQMLIENSCSSNMAGRYFFMTGQEMADFIDEFNHPLLQAVWDFGHGQAHGLRQSEQLITLGPRLRALHVHDTITNGDLHMMPFCGTTDFDDVMQGLLAADYKGAFTFEVNQLLRPCRPAPDLAERRLTQPSPEMRYAALCLLYQTGKHILQQYNCFEG